MSQSLRLILMPDGSMERLCILSEKTPSNLKTSENGWREKYQSCVLWHKFSIHFRLTTNPMVWKSFLVHKLSIHFRLVFMSDGGLKQDRPKRLHPFWDLIKSDGGFKQDRPKRLHPYWNLIKSDGGFIQECLKKLHPFFALIKSDGGCHSHANRKSQKKCNWQG